MKKAISLILAMLIMTVCVFADVPEFLTKPVTNATTTSSISITFDSSESIVALLEELESPEEIEAFVDLNSLLKTLLSYDGKATVQADISDDYKKMKVGLTLDSVQNVDVNTNLNIGVNSKMGMWMNVDFSAEQPVMEYIYSLPIMNKYFKMNLLDSVEVAEMIKAFYNKEYISDITKQTMGILVKYADIEKSGSRYTIKFDNESFTSYLDEVLSCVYEKSEEIYKSIGIVGGIYNPLEYLPSVKGWKLLGENGFVCTYTTRNGKITKAEESIDISVDISEIYKAATGEEWAYSSNGLLDFTITAKSEISKVGSTKVTFPKLTAENTIEMSDFIPEYEMAEQEYEYLPEVTYPNYYVSESCSKLMMIDGNLYVPLRQTLDAAYGETVAISYNNGVITAECEYFPTFKQLKLTVGSNKVYADEIEHFMGTVIEEDGISYVNSAVFCDIFGWELSWAEYNMLDNWYHYTFYTE